MKFNLLLIAALFSLFVLTVSVTFVNNVATVSSTEKTKISNIHLSNDNCGIEVCNADLYQYEPVICHVGSGSVINAWLDGRNHNSSSNTDIYAQKMDIHGNMKWITNGIMIHNSSKINTLRLWDLQICDDGQGGAIIVWANFFEPSAFEIYAQRIDSNGNTLWNNNGLLVGNGSHSVGVLYSGLQVCSDESGGVILIWYEYRDITTQRIDLNGNKLWSDNSLVFLDVLSPAICSDGSGGVILVWSEKSSDDSGIYTQAINSTGNLKWGENNLTIYTRPDRFYSESRICSDGLGGVIIAWPTVEGGRAQRVDFNGNILWENNGTIIGSYYPQDIVSDGNNGAFYTYVDYWTEDNNHKIYGQRINMNGEKLWGLNGTLISKTNDQNWVEYLQICSDGVGGALITWNFRKNWFVNDPPYNNTDIYVQKINSNGDRVWKENGIPVCVPASDFRIQDVNVQICNDGEGGAIISYEFVRTRWNEDYHYQLPYLWDIHAQRISSGGDLQWNVEPNWIFFVIIGVIIGGIAIAVFITVVLIKRRK